MNNAYRLLIAFLLICMAISVCNGEETLNPSHAHFAYVTEAVIATGANIPDTPTPDSDECLNCGGDGVLGDGRTKITCPECDGTGKRKTTTVPIPIPDPNTNGWPPRTMGLEPVFTDQPAIHPAFKGYPGAETETRPWVVMTKPMFGVCNYCGIQEAELWKLQGFRIGTRYGNRPPYPGLYLRNSKGEVRELRGYHRADVIRQVMESM